MKLVPRRALPLSGVCACCIMKEVQFLSYMEWCTVEAGGPHTSSKKYEARELNEPWAGMFYTGRGRFIIAIITSSERYKSSDKVCRRDTYVSTTRSIAYLVRFSQKPWRGLVSPSTLKPLHYSEHV